MSICFLIEFFYDLEREEEAAVRGRQRVAQ